MPFAQSSFCNSAYLAASLRCTRASRTSNVPFFENRSRRGGPGVGTRSKTHDSSISSNCTLTGFKVMVGKAGPSLGGFAHFNVISSSVLTTAIMESAAPRSAEDPRSTAIFLLFVALLSRFTVW